MFTGIVEELGTVKKIKKGANSAVFTIRAEKILDDLKTGDSVAVNGICLTVTACLEDGFTADVMHETLNRSALIQLSLGQHVNLERAMPANGRFGGHIVAGHVDGTGKITEIAGPVSDQRLCLHPNGCDHQFSPLTVRQNISLFIYDLCDTMILPHVHALMSLTANRTPKSHLSGTIMRPEWCSQNFFYCFHYCFRTGIP